MSTRAANDVPATSLAGKPMVERRTSALERQRESDLLRWIPERGARALDIGARDGHFSLVMAERFDEVVALDLQLPVIDHPRVRCVEGNAARLPYPDRSFDFVLCAEVLEHVPPDVLPGVCAEIQRVCAGQTLIGVPNEQDIRVGRLSCNACGKIGPPWGHVNSFDQARLLSMFPGFQARQISLVGARAETTNALAVWLMDKAGNPHSGYKQDELCVHCGASYTAPPERSFAQKVMTRLSYWAQRPTDALSKPKANWVHVLFSTRT